MTPNPQYPNPGAAAPKITPGIAIAAFVLGLIGMCVPCLGLIGVILGIVALVKIGNDAALGGRVWAILGIVLPLVAIPIQAAIAIPNFIKFQARSKQAECKANLKAAYFAESQYYQQHDAFSPNIGEVGFQPERGNRYAYFLYEVGAVEDRSTAQVESDPRAVGVNVDTFKHRDLRPLAMSDLPELAGDAKPGVHGQCPKCSFTAVCIGNVDQDAVLDVWSVSSQSRTGPDGQAIPPGVPYNDVSDVNN
ncbi:MAG TPA: fimbrial protein [Myxococcales bacterium]|nr:fimbrial protein [Myxococcales bacterium]